MIEQEATWMARMVKPVRISTKGQVVIPLGVRRKLGIKAGGRLVIVSGQDEALIMKAKRYAESIRGMGKALYGKTREEIESYVRGEREARGEISRSSHGRVQGVCTLGLTRRGLSINPQ